MLIFSRDKDKIINTKNIIGLCIDEELYETFSFSSQHTGTCYTIVAICDKKTIEIGRYDTRERAEEVLKELYNEELLLSYETTFEMPEKWGAKNEWNCNIK